MSDNKKLLPCPFCSGEAKFRILGINSTSTCAIYDFGIQCAHCGVRIPEDHRIIFTMDSNTGKIYAVTDERDEAIREWNRRINCNESL